MVDSVDLHSGMEELKRRLEILLGAKPEAPLDQTEKARQLELAQEQARKERIAAAGGQLLSSAFAFLGELLPAPAETDASQRLGQLLRQQLDQCLETDARGRLNLTVTLPDPGSVGMLADSLARLLSARPGAS